MTHDEIIRKKKEFIFDCATTYYKDPLVVDHAKGQYVCDVEGRQYLDFFGGIVTVSVGHANEKVTTKIKKQIDKVQHTSTAHLTEAMVALAEKMAAIAPGRLKKSYFTNSGSEANEVAVITARMYTGNQEILALRHGYSGHTQLTKSMTGMSTWRKAGLVPQAVVHAPGPYCYRCPYGLTYPSCELHCAKDIEEVIKTSTGGSVAAMLAETIQGAGGFIVPPPGYFKIVANIVRNYGGLFIADEVQAGFGRTGKKWFGIEHWEVEPDIITMAKGMANGAPIGCTITRPEIADAYKGLTISTFGGNPVTCAAAKATIDLIEEDRLMDNADVLGRRFREGLEGLKEKYEAVGDARGMGLMQGFELVKSKKTKEPAPDLTNQLMERTRSNGLLVGKGGLYGNVIRMSPPLNITKDNVDTALGILDKSLSEL
ncbi:MAG: aspartate aminotransferase family protein [Acidobacteria bacterium]|nr:MAG: aspartate aminotransferase family protein [Acidobacteriota bacterium]